MSWKEIEMNESIRPGRLSLLNSLTLVAVALAMPTLASGQRRHSDAEIRNCARIGVLNAMDQKYGRGAEAKVTKITEGDMVGEDRRMSGEGTFLVGRDRHDFTFDCIVDTRRVMA